MRKLTKEELIKIQGGAKISAAFITSLVKGVSIILELGRSVGTAIRRASSGRLC